MIHVTDHARERWHSRASKSGHDNVHDIIEAVKDSEFIKKGQPLPYGLPRLPNTVYSIRDGVVFVMEAMTIDEYRLVTVITEDEKSKVKRATGPPKKPPSRYKRLLRKSQAKRKQEEEFHDNGSCTNHKKRTTRKKRREKEIPSSEEVDGLDPFA
jgi:hypothetical protein